MNYSRYQLAIFEWAKTGTGHAVVDAVAGSGKTTTLIELMNRLPGRSQFLAFNKHTAEAIAAKAPMMASVSTINAFGNGLIRAYKSTATLDRFKTGNILKDMLPYKDYLRCRNQVQQVVSLMKAGYDGLTFDTIESIIDSYGITFPKPKESDPIDYIRLCEKVFKEVLEEKSVYDFDDQIFWPVYFGYEVPKIKNVLVDEAQDLSPIQLELISRMFDSDGRLVAVGDPRQAIYMFRGAGCDSIGKIISRFQAQVLPLSVCYRCPKLVVEQAQQIVPHIEVKDGAEDGEVKEVKIKDWQPVAGDLVLCRTTAPLVTQCLQGIREGRRGSVKGRDIGEGLNKLADNAMLKDDETDLDTLRQYRTLTLNKMKHATEEAVVSVMDQIDTLQAIIEYAENEGKPWRNVIKDLFSDDKERGILYATIHRSKGLEYPNVHIIRPDLIPHPRCQQGEQLKQEMNLKYVAITRAMKTLTWVYDN